nr:hypothetical protein [Tanacetum cinerariifolium]
NAEECLDKERSDLQLLERKKVNEKLGKEKVFPNVALKNELRKLKGNSVDTKFAKPSILGKPVLQPPRNQSVVRQPNAFKFERTNFSKPRFTSQVDVNNILSKPVTPYYLPKVRESVPAKPHHVNAPSSSRNSKKESYGSNDMAHNYYLEKAKKKTPDQKRNLKPREMPSAKTHHTPNAGTQKPRSNNQTSRNWPASKSYKEMLKAVQKADHSRNPSLFSNFKHFVCSTCQKCVFNANHDACITKLLKEINSRAKIQPNKTRNSNKPVDPTSHTQKPGGKIVTGHSFSPNKSSAVHEKTNTPRSCLRWIPMARILNTTGLKWVPIGKTFTSSTTKVDCEPPNGSNGYITNPYKCDQTFNVSAGKWRYLIPAITQIHNHMLIPNYQDFKIQDFRYSDGFECFQAINIGRYEHLHLSPVRANLLPPRKRIRGSVSATAQDDSTEESYKAYMEPNIDFDVQTDIDADTTVAEAAAAREADVGVKFSIGSGGEDEAEEEA